MARSTAALRAGWILLVVAVFLAACSGQAPSESTETIDPTAVEAVLTTDPATPEANQEVTLAVQLTGAEFPASTTVNIDVRQDRVPTIIKTQTKGDNVFTGTFTLPKAGVYDVYLHIYIRELHLTKKKQVEVR